MTSPNTNIGELDKILFVNFGDSSLAQIEKAKTQLEALLSAAKIEELNEALVIVEQKNDVAILNWFDNRIKELEQQ
jgi:hypothetical protein